MAVIEEALYSILTTDAGFSALVGSRVYPLQIPQDAALPATAYQRISGLQVFSLSGSSGLARPRFQLTHVADEYSVVNGVANAARAALNGYRNTIAGVEVQAAFLENDDDAYARETGLFVIRQDYFIWHVET